MVGMEPKKIAIKKPLISEGLFCFVTYYCVASSELVELLVANADFLF